MRRDKRTTRAFALYEVLLGLSIFIVGVLMLGRSVQNCLNASILSRGRRSGAPDFIESNGGNPSDPRISG